VRIINVVPMLYQRKSDHEILLHNRLIFFVVWGGIEPPTQGFSVLKQLLVCQKIKVHLD